MCKYSDFEVRINLTPQLDVKGDIFGASIFGFNEQIKEWEFLEIEWDISIEKSLSKAIDRYMNKLRKL